MPAYKVNVGRLVTVHGPRTYSNQLHAGVREVIANAMDYSATIVKIFIHNRNISIENNGDPLNPDEIEKYVTIASDHQRDSDMRGEFGWGHLALLGLSKWAELKTIWKGEEHAWMLLPTEYIPYLPRSSSETFGLKVTYKNIKEPISLRSLKLYLKAVFSIPLFKGTLKILVNGKEITTLLPRNTVIKNIKMENDDIKIYYVPKHQGKIYWCHKGVGVRAGNFVGPLGFIDEDILELKLSKEGYVTNKKYSNVRGVISRFLQTLIPKTPYKDKEKRVLKRFLKLLRGTLPTNLIEKDSEVDYAPRKKGIKKGTHDSGVSSIEKKKRKIKGLKGIHAIKKGLAYPFLWYDADAQVLVWNQTHPITQDFVEKSYKMNTVELHALLPLNRAQFCIQLFSTKEEASWLLKEFTLSDRNTANSLIKQEGKRKIAV